MGNKHFRDNLLPTLFLLFCILFPACTTYSHLSDTEGSRYEIGTDETDFSEGIDNMILPYRKDLNAEMEKVIGRVATPLEKGKPESSLGNWVCDALQSEAQKYTATNIDFTISNYGGLRISSIPKGDVSVGKIYELMPFENMLVIVDVPGHKLQTLFDHMAKSQGWPISQEATYIIKGNKARDIKINGASFEEDRIYKVLTSDYVANGGDRSKFFKDMNKEELNVLFRSVLIQACLSNTQSDQPIEAYTDGRVKIQ